MSIAEAAELLELSERHVKRFKAAYDAAHPRWVHQGNQNRVPANAISDEVRKQVVELASGKYAGFNDSHRQEKLVSAGSGR